MHARDARGASCGAAVVGGRSTPRPLLLLLSKGVIHKLREQGGGGGVSEMFTFVHKGGGESFANVHVAFLRVIFQHFLHNIFSQ